MPTALERLLGTYTGPPILGMCAYCAQPYDVTVRHWMDGYCSVACVFADRRDHQREKDRMPTALELEVLERRVIRLDIIDMQILWLALMAFVIVHGNASEDVQVRVQSLCKTLTQALDDTGVIRADRT